jgi:DNA-binding IclR family transcriptional regulator
MEGQTYHVLDALGHPDRAAIVIRLLEGEARERDLLGELGLPQKTANRHFATLRQVGLVARNGQKAPYRLVAPTETRAALEMVNALALRIVEIRLAEDQALGRRLRRGRLEATDGGMTA